MNHRKMSSFWIKLELLATVGMNVKEKTDILFVSEDFLFQIENFGV